MGCLNCGGDIHPANITRYRGCCSSACFDTFDDQQEITQLRAELDQAHRLLGKLQTEATRMWRRAQKERGRAQDAERREASLKFDAMNARRGEDEARLEIYRIQEAYGSGGLKRLDEAIQVSYLRFPHQMTNGMRQSSDFQEAFGDGG